MRIARCLSSCRRFSSFHCVSILHMRIARCLSSCRRFSSFHYIFYSTYAYCPLFIQLPPLFELPLYILFYICVLPHKQDFTARIITNYINKRMVGDKLFWFRLQIRRHRPGDHADSCRGGGLRSLLVNLDK